MEVTSMDKRYLRRLTSMYIHVQALLDPEPEEASAHKQRQMREWLCKKYKKPIQSLPAELRDLLTTEAGDTALFPFMKQCQDEMQKLLDGEKRRFYQEASSLPYDARAALWKLSQGTNWPAVTRHGDDLEIAVDGTEAYRRRLFLRGVSDIPEGEEDLRFGAIELMLTREGDRYRLSGEEFDAMADDYREYSFTFETAEVITEVYDAINSICVWDHPWTVLITAASSIVAKAYLPGSHCNDLELQMLPLLTELAALDDWDELPSDLPFTFPALKSLAEKHGCDTLVPLFDELGQKEPESQEYTSQVQKIIGALCDSSVEPLWREVFEKIHESQAAYPDKADICCPAPILTATREEIAAQMKQHGFDGTYPNFVKVGPLRGIHLEDSYDTAHFIGPKSHMVSRIHCIETVIDRELTVQFLCGTALLADGEEAEDIYACLFDDGARHLFHHTEYTALLYEPDYTYTPKDLAICVSVAAKKAQLQRLSKEELNAYTGTKDASMRTFLTFLVVVGGIFGLTMTLGMMGLTALIALCFGANVGAIVWSVPWWLVILFCWVGYGGTMGIITMLAKRR